MRNFKRFLSLVMATLMILSVAVITTGAADTTADYTDAAQHLVALKIMKGDNGNLMLDNGVTRYQAALFFVQALSGETSADVWNAQKTSVNFKDVVEYGTAIDYAYGRKIVVGRGNGVFGYNDPITYQDMLVMAVRALGYETEDMSYPYGYILAAQKLGLTDDIAKTVNYTAPLTRGETAQIMWNMLNTEIAVEDPINGKILYPGDTGLTDALINDPDKKITRVTLLEDAGYASDKLVGTVTDFVEGKDGDFDTVEVTVGADTYTLNAADLGITAKTAQIGYMGLPVTLLIDCAEDEFEGKYAVDPDESKASVVYAEFETYTTVENLGKAGNIKYNATDDVLTLNGTKFAASKNEFAVYTFTADGWEEVADAAPIFDNFKYTTKDGYCGDVATANTYGKFAYRVVKDGHQIAGASTPETNDDKFEDRVEILYTPYAFGQYSVRTLRYQATAKDADFATIGMYKADQTVNVFDEKTPFKEYFLNAKFNTSNPSAVSNSTVSKPIGAAALEVALEGEAVKSGDFVFYSYNAVDNILTVAQNCGAFKEGRLTGSNEKLKTVKIDGANKTVGFKGLTPELAGKNTLADYDITADFVAKLAAGKNNVKYIEADGNVVFMMAAEGSTSDNKNVFDFVIATLDSKVMGDLLGYTGTADEKAEKYEADCIGLTTGEKLYLNDDGYVSIAVLNKTTGKFELASLKNFHYGDYSADDEKFASKKDVGTLVKYADLVGDHYSGKADLQTIYGRLTGAVIFYAVDESNGVYDLASTSYTEAEKLVLDAGDNTKGLIFSDAKAVTNEMKATSDDDVEEARVSLTSDTVVVVIDGMAVKTRVGVQKSKNSVKLASGTAKILSANSSLIVMDATDATFETGFVLENWGKGTSAALDETYYISLADSTVDSNTADGETYTITVTNLFDLRTMKTVESVEISVEKSDFSAKYTALNDAVTAKGALLKSADDTLTVDGKTYAAAALELVENDDAEAVTLTGMNFKDSSTIELTYPVVDSGKATDIKIKVITLDVTGLDKDAYDYNSAFVSNVDYDEDDAKAYGVTSFDAFSKTDAAVKYYSYVINGDVVEEIVEPIGGIFDNFVNDMAGKQIVIPVADLDFSEYDNVGELTADDYETVTVSVGAFGEYDDKAGTLDMTVIKVVK